MKTLSLEKMEGIEGGTRDLDCYGLYLAWINATTMAARTTGDVSASWEAQATYYDHAGNNYSCPWANSFI